MSGEGGAATSTGPGSTSASSSVGSSSKSVATTGTGGAPGVGGAGGDGTGGSSGGSAPTGTGGSGGGDVGGEGGSGGCDADLDTDVDNCGACGRACAGADHQVVDRACAGGLCRPLLCSEGFSSVNKPEAPEGDDGCETAWRRVFVTDALYPIPFQAEGITGTGAEAADSICQQLTTDAQLEGTWMAWISDGELLSPSERFTRHAVPYWLLDEATVIAQSFADLTNGDILEPIHVTETGESLFAQFPKSSGFAVWTATATNGTATASDCSDWTIGADGESGQVGMVFSQNVNLPAAAWTAHAQLFPCGSEEAARLYCFEQ